MLIFHLRLVAAIKTYLLLIFTCLPAIAWSSWYNSSWNYRVPIDIPVNSPIHATVRVDVDFNALLTDLNATGSFDPNSPRIVRADDATLATFQEFTDSIYQTNTDPVNNGIGEIKFIIEDKGPTTYYLYFDTLTNGNKSANPQKPINGNFEHSSTGTQNPSGWTASKSSSSFDAQIRPSETYRTGTDYFNKQYASPNPVTSDGTPHTGQYSYLLGSRTNIEPTKGTVSLSRSFIVPATSPGNLTINYRLEGWDSSENNYNRYDYLIVRLIGKTTVDVVGPDLGNYRSYPFSPNYGRNYYGSSNPGYGYYNGWDTDRYGRHYLGMSLTRGSEPWFSKSYDLSAFAGQTVSLGITMSHNQDYKTWVHVDDVEWSLIKGILGTPSSYISDVSASNFSCVEIGSDAGTGHIFTKLAGTAFKLDAVALNKDNGVEENYAADQAKTVILDFVDGSGTTACASRTLISSVTSQKFTFDPTDKGRHPFSFTISEAHPNVRCRITDANQTPEVVGCSNDNFSVRPTSLTVSSSADADGNGLDVSAIPKIKAGSIFSMKAIADFKGYTTAPNIDSSKIIAHTGSAAIGTLNGIFENAEPATGAAEGLAFSYSEVGYFKFDVQGIYDDQFTRVDSINGDCLANFNNVLNSGKYGCNFGNISATDYFGRFTPDHFELSLNVPSFNPGCDTFSYIGQPLKYSVNPIASVIAKNANDSITQNYRQGFWKIDPLDATYGITPSYTEAVSTLTIHNAIAPVVIDNDDGTGSITFADTISDILAIVRGDPVNPFDAEIAMSFSLTDTDDVTVADVDGVTQTNPVYFGNTTTGNGINFLNDKKNQRWGRLTLKNAHGSELLPLTIPVSAEYFSNDVFIPNNEDNCTQTNLVANYYLANPDTSGGSSQSGDSSMTISPSGTTTSALSQSQLVAGSAELVFSAPGLGNTGNVDISSDFSSMSWLLFDWNGIGLHTGSPTARATFGRYQGDAKHIFIRENY